MSLSAPAFGAVVWGTIALVVAAFAYEAYLLAAEAGYTVGRNS